MEGDAGEGRVADERPGDTGAGDGPGERPADGLDHLRAAAGELIQACRAVLDVAEELLDDPATVEAVADGFGALLRGAADLGRRAASGATGPGRADDPTGDDPAGGGPDDPDPGASRVQRIRVV